MKPYLRNEIYSDEKMLLMPSDCCVFSSYRSANFYKEIYVTTYEGGLLKNRK